MAREEVLKTLLYPKCKTAIEFKFDSLRTNPLLTYITPQDIYQLYKIATSIKYASKPQMKYKMIDDILTQRGFKKIASGTNRVVYRYLNDYSIVLKVAIDKVGLSDNGNEFINQNLLKPFVTKCFEVSPCGTVGLFERVIPITSREEFIHISSDVFDLINNIIGKYVLEDIGEKYFMNYGLREGFGPVLLDYPYVFELDGRKLFCNVEDPLSPKGYCGGEIDYDEGYNNLVCSKCGKRYLATELKSDESDPERPKIIVEGEDIIMKCILMRGDEVVSRLNSNQEVATETIKPRKDFNRLKARLSVEPVKEEKIVYDIKTHDDVKLQCRVKGRIREKNIDKEAREKERLAEQQSKKIVINLATDEPPVVLDDVVKVVSEEVIRDIKIEPEKVETAPIVVDVPENFDYTDSMQDTNDRTITVHINSMGEILTEDNKLVGYTPVDVEEIKDIPSHEEVIEEKVQPPVRVKNEEAETVYTDIDTGGNTIGDILRSKMSESGNFSSEKFTSQIDGYLSSPEVKNKLNKSNKIDLF